MEWMKCLSSVGEVINVFSSCQYLTCPLFQLISVTPPATGNIYVMFKREEDAQKAVDGLNNRWYNGQPIYAELSPVTDFREACCRQHETSECTRGGYCNFLHVKPASREMRHSLGVDTYGKGRHVAGGKRRDRSPRRDRNRRN